uniref:Reverse transcriptase zinc-binding domain-containing protein n=1 Tax=Oryza barthii TaxID=65489 RepID=A0A0D3GYZ1_9ORYZ
MDHILVSCPESRHSVLNAIGRTEVLPTTQNSFVSWWCNSRKRISKQLRKGFDTIVTLMAWSIWKECNR